MIDHTTVENTGLQNCFSGSLNRTNVRAKNNALPVFSHDQKDNFEATRFVSEESFKQINELPTQSLQLNLTDTPETNISFPEFTSTINKFCNRCHDENENCLCKIDPEKQHEQHKELFNVEPIKIENIEYMSAFYENARKRRFSKNVKFEETCSTTFRTRKKKISSSLIHSIRHIT